MGILTRCLLQIPNVLLTNLREKYHLSCFSNFLYVEPKSGPVDGNVLYLRDKHRTNDVELMKEK